MNTKVKNEIISLARADPAHEVCGLIVCAPPQVLVHPCTNISRDEDGQEHTFEIDSQEYISACARGKVCGIYHSHPHGPVAFSQADIEVADAMELPSHLYVTDADAWITYIPRGYTVPLTGQEFTWGTQDCYETVRIYYRQKLGIYLGDYDRDENFRDAAPDAILKHISSEGFINLGRDLSVIQEHDVLLFDTPGHRYPHHLGIYTGGSNRFLHHPFGALSRIDDLDQHYLNRLLSVLRYGRTALKAT